MSNQNKVKILEGVRNLLWDGHSFKGSQHKYICDCITHGPDKSYPFDRMQLREIIHERLGHQFSVSAWLAMQGVPQRDLTNIRVQAHRKAWVEMLIEEFSKK